MDKILVIDDDVDLTNLVEEFLVEKKYKIQSFNNPLDGLKYLKENKIELIILDIMLPEMDGFQVLRKIRETLSTPVIMLTARGEVTDRIVGLELGADDYVAKPFSLRELMARVKARMRNVVAAAPEFIEGGVYEFGKVKVDLRKRIVWSEEGELRLTTHEAGVLEYLIAKQGTDVSRDELLQQVWGYAQGTTTRTVDNQILKLRKKVELEPSNPRHILTVHGTGYRFEP